MTVTKENYAFNMGKLNGLLAEKEVLDFSIEFIANAIAEYEKTVGEK